MSGKNTDGLNGHAGLAAAVIRRAVRDAGSKNVELAHDARAWVRSDNCDQLLGLLSGSVGVDLDRQRLIDVIGE